MIPRMASIAKGSRSGWGFPNRRKDIAVRPGSRPTTTSHVPTLPGAFTPTQTLGSPYVPLPGGRAPIGSTNPNWTFKPWKAPPVPTNLYDPAIDAQVGQSDRGYLDTQLDTGLANQRAQTDYGIGMAGLSTGLGRTTTDLATAREQQTQDYNRNVMLLARSYTNLANRQKQQQNGAGVLDGGAVAQAALKRAANQALEQQPMDTQNARFLADNSQQLSRAQEDNAVQVAGLGLGLQRGQEDRELGLTRAGREHSQFGLDAEKQRQFQGAQNGYIAPAPGTKGGQPKNQYVTEGGRTLRKIVKGTVEYHVDKDGKIVSYKHVSKKKGK